MTSFGNNDRLLGMRGRSPCYTACEVEGRGFAAILLRIGLPSAIQPSFADTFLQRELMPAEGVLITEVVELTNVLYKQRA